MRAAVMVMLYGPFVDCRSIDPTRYAMTRTGRP